MALGYGEAITIHTVAASTLLMQGKPIDRRRRGRSWLLESLFLCFRVCCSLFLIVELTSLFRIFSLGGGNGSNGNEGVEVQDEACFVVVFHADSLPDALFDRFPTSYKGLKVFSFMHHA